MTVTIRRLHKPAELAWAPRLFETGSSIRDELVLELSV
jgi:hypothetical protein